MTDTERWRKHYLKTSLKQNRGGRGKKKNQTNRRKNREFSAKEDREGGQFSVGRRKGIEL